MAKCKSCKKDIVDGSDYCEDCLHKDRANSNESYLDNLLNSVMKPKESDITDFVDDQDIKDFDQLDITEELEDSEDFNDQEDFSDLDDEINISDEELFGISLDEEEKVEEDNIKTSDNVNPTSNIDEDILGLLNQMSSEDPFMAGITDMLEENNYNTSELEEDIKSVETGDSLSDVLAGINPLDEDDMVEEISRNLNDEELEKKKTNKQEKLKKLTSETDAMVLSELVNDKAKNKKPSIFSKIFGGSAIKSPKNEQTPDKTEVDMVTSEDTRDINTDKKSGKKAAKSKKASKKAKETNKVQDAKTEDTGENQEEDSQSDKKLSKKEARKAKKAEKRKAKAITTVVKEVEEDPSTINPVGTAIALLTFGAIAFVIYFGSYSFAYNKCINYAKSYFDKREYSKAYEEISGMDLKEDDVEIYNKLQTVMFVNKQLNSYYNYYNLSKYPEALDSLLKGLQRYDKYIELATFYGVKSDLDFVRDQIIIELGNTYDLTEEDAINLINIGNKTEYSTEVYKVAMGNN